MATRPVDPEGPRAEPLSARTGLPRVLAIVVTHNGRAWFKESLVGLNNQTYPFLDVLVVDDASTDARHKPTLKRIAKRHLKRRRWGIVRTPRPFGFGGAINWALSRVKTDADLLLFIHDDAAMDLDAVERMVARMIADQAAAIVGPKIVGWDDPSQLEEVGMAVDSFGYPYKGIEDNEIDLGQRDQSVEVFFVTSTCMLMKHDVFRELRGWDARLRAFSEDLDLCWRARVAGYSVRVEPAARVRHAIALARGYRRSPFTPQRYFIRRNRLRTVAKNVATLRLFFLVPLFVLLSFVEMIGFVALRQFREIPNLAKALGWNLLQMPQTLAERAKVQRKRAVPDRRLQRLTVREGTRIRAYASHQAARLEEAWGRRAEVLAQKGQEARLFGARLKGWTGVLVTLGVIGFLLGFRHLLWGPPAAVGELLPYPERGTAMLRAFFSPWRGSGLGEPGIYTPAYALLSVFQFVALGAAGAAEKLLVLSLGGIAFTGVYRLVAGFVDRPSRVAAGLAYAVGAVGYSGIREGALGALVFGAAAPFVFGAIVRLIGWTRPPGWVPGRAVAQVALGAAVSAAFVPGSLVLYGISAILLALARNLLDHGPKAIRGLIASGVGLVTAFLMLMPWSTTWFADGGVFDRLLGADTWRDYAAGFAGHGAASVVLGQTPDVPAFFGLALPLLGIVAVLVGDGQRRRFSLALWLVIVAVAVLVGAVGSGVIRPFVASPTEAGVVVAMAFSGLVGLAVGAFRLDLPRRGLGLVHALTLGAVAASAFLVFVGLGPALLQGDWGPGRADLAHDPGLVAQISDLLGVEAAGDEQFRTLWVGDRWESPAPTAARPQGRFTITGPRGVLLTNLFVRTEGAADHELRSVLATVERGQTDQGGALLGAFNVRFVVLDRGEGTYRWLSQRDLALIRSEPEYLLLENLERVERAAVYAEVPLRLEALDRNDPALVAGALPPPLSVARRESSWKFRDDDPAGPGAVVLTETEDPGWRASAAGEPLPRLDAGWANAFELPGDASDLVIEYRRTTSRLVLGLFVGLLWVIVVGGAFSRSRSPSGRGEIG